LEGEHLKSPSHFLCAVCVLASLLLNESCASLYSGAVLGHDFAEVPFPDTKSGGPSADFALSMKVTPTVWEVTQDRTLSGLMSASVFFSVAASETARFCFGFVGSGYLAQTSISVDDSNGSPGSVPNGNHILGSSGLTGEMKTGFILDPVKPIACRDHPRNVPVRRKEVPDGGK
jgi:hypothetical protein